MSKRLTARSAYDMKNKPLGVVVVSDKGLVEKYEPAEGEEKRFTEAVYKNWPIEELQGRYRLFTFVDDDEADVEKDAEVRVEGEITKVDPAKRHVFGWGYITHTPTGEVNVDKSGDFTDEIEQIEKSAYDYVLRSRQGDADHTNVPTSSMIESVVFTPEKIEKMGIPEGVVPLGWWLGYKIDDDATWERVEKGELKAFSIHGKGTRSKVEE